jgi:hypothetical protein
VTLNRGDRAATAYVSAVTRVPQARIRSVFAKLSKSGITGDRPVALGEFVAGQIASAIDQYGSDGERLAMSLSSA